jgi:uncharacterized membrane protein YfcA
LDLLHAVILMGAGVGGGIIATIVGGASIVTFPALIAAGISPAVAAATNMTALTPGILISAIFERNKLPPFDRGFVSLVISSLVGSMIGAAMLLLTPSPLFNLVVPILLGLATVLFAFGPRLSAWLRARSFHRHGREPKMSATSIPVLLPVSIYNGYFGAGAGVMLLAVFSIWSAGDYRSANVTKNLVTSLNSLVAATLFTIQGMVNWRAAALMMVGGLVGSALGVRVARVAPREIIQVVVVFMGAALTALYAWRYWF